MYDRIVLAVDGSDEARHAAKRGLQLATAFDASVDACYVVQQRSLRLTRTSDEKSQLRDEGEAALAEIETLAAELDHPITTHVSEGDPAGQVCEYAGERDADLVVVGRQGITGLGRRLLGGVTERVLQRSEIPVFVVPSADRDVAEISEYDRVLIPTDGSENAAVATPHGAAMAGACNGAVDVLYVVDLQNAGGPFSAGGLDQTFVERLEANGREAVESVERDLSEIAPDLDVQTAVERTRSFDGAGAGIRDYVETNDVDLVVMGSHGRSNVRRQLLGSVASTVLRTVDVPVLIGPRATRKDAA